MFSIIRASLFPSVCALPKEKVTNTATYAWNKCAVATMCTITLAIRKLVPISWNRNKECLTERAVQPDYNWQMYQNTICGFSLLTHSLRHDNGYHATRKLRCHNNNAHSCARVCFSIISDRKSVCESFYAQWYFRNGSCVETSFWGCVHFGYSINILLGVWKEGIGPEGMVELQ